MDKTIEKMARDRIAAHKADEEKRQQELEQLTTERDEKRQLRDAARQIMDEQLSDCDKELEKLDQQIAKLQSQPTKSTPVPAAPPAVDTAKTSAPALPAGPQTPSQAPAPTADQSAPATQPSVDSDDPYANVADRYNSRLDKGQLTWLERRRFAKGLAQAEYLTLTEVLAEFDKVDRERTRFVNDPDLASAADRQEQSGESTSKQNLPGFAQRILYGRQRAGRHV